MSTTEKSQSASNPFSHRKKCNRCCLYLRLELFKLKRDDNYQKNCIECNKKISEWKQQRTNDDKLLWIYEICSKNDNNRCYYIQSINDNLKKKDIKEDITFFNIPNIRLAENYDYNKEIEIFQEVISSKNFTVRRMRIFNKNISSHEKNIIINHFAVMKFSQKNFNERLKTLEDQNETREAYYQNNALKILANGRERIICEVCNKDLARGSLSKHKKSKEHQNNILEAHQQTN